MPRLWHSLWPAFELTHLPNNSMLTAFVACLVAWAVACALHQNTMPYGKPAATHVQLAAICCTVSGWFAKKCLELSCPVPGMQPAPGCLFSKGSP